MFCASPCQTRWASAARVAGPPRALGRLKSESGHHRTALGEREGHIASAAAEVKRGTTGERFREADDDVSTNDAGQSFAGR